MTSASVGSLPAVELFSTSILSNHKVRSRHERYTGVFAIKEIPYIYHDLASNEDAKARWRRKAKDSQLPGILVNNEWRGNYEEFEEAIEFGGLEMFLGVDDSAAAAAAAPAAQTPQPPAAAAATDDDPTATIHAAQQAVSSKDPSLYPTINFAPEGSGKRAELTAEEFISTLGLTDDSLTEAEADALLASIGTAEGIQAAQAPMKKAFTPSPEAAVKPLRLARMGKSSSSSTGGGTAGGGGSRLVNTSPRSPPIARYSISQRSGRALAAEASALVTNRKTSGALLREAVSQGKDLDEALEHSRMKDLVSNEDLDHLFASLGLKDADLAEEEAEAFLEGGAIPDGLQSGGTRLTRSSTKADKVRDEAAAREVAQRAREKGFRGAAAAAPATSETIAEDEQEAAVTAATATAASGEAFDKEDSKEDTDAARASLAEVLEVTESKSNEAEPPAKVDGDDVDAEATKATAAERAAESTGKGKEVGGGAKREDSTSPRQAENGEAAASVAAVPAQVEPPAGSEVIGDVEPAKATNDSATEPEGQADDPTLVVAGAETAGEVQAPATQPPVATPEEPTSSLPTSATGPVIEAQAKAAAEEATSLPATVEDEPLGSVDAASAQAAAPSTSDDDLSKAETAVQTGTADVAADVAADVVATDDAQASDTVQLSESLSLPSTSSNAPALGAAAAPAAVPEVEIISTSAVVDETSKFSASVETSTSPLSPTLPLQPIASNTSSSSSASVAVPSKANKAKPRPSYSPTAPLKSRKAMDVSRPIPAPLSPSNSAAAPSTSSATSSLSPTHRKILPFKTPSFGRKETTTVDEKKMTAAAGGGRHQRTISEILREADAVLGEDYDSEEEDEEVGEGGEREGSAGSAFG